MSMVLDPARVSEQKKKIQGIVEDIAGSLDEVHWRYSAYSNERFPLRAYASAVRGSGPDAHEVLVIAVTWRNPNDERGDRLVVGAATLDEDGGLLAESPRFEIPSPESVEPKGPHQTLDHSTVQVREAMPKINEWLDSQTATILEALARAA